MPELAAQLLWRMGFERIGDARQGWAPILPPAVCAQRGNMPLQAAQALGGPRKARTGKTMLGGVPYLCPQKLFLEQR